MCSTVVRSTRIFVLWAAADAMASNIRSFRGSALYWSKVPDSMTVAEWMGLCTSTWEISVSRRRQIRLLQCVT